MTENLIDIDETPFREVTGNTPLSLDDPERLWLVVAGWVDVFAVPGRVGQPTGGRIHLFRAQVGQLLCGVQGGKESAHLLCLGMPGSQVAGLDRGQFRQQMAAAPQPGQFCALVDSWVRGLTAGVARGLLPPRHLTPLEPNRETWFDGEEIVTPARGVLWVGHGQGDLGFLGEERLVLVGSSGLFPVSIPGWLATRRRTCLIGRPTEAVLNDPQLWSALEHFHRLILACTVLNQQRAVLAERDRFQRRQQHDRQMVQAALTTLVGVVGPGEEEAAPLGEGDSPLFAACRLVGAALGIVLRPAQEPTETRRGGETLASVSWGTFQRVTLATLEGPRRSDPVLAIARASRVRVRRVLLEGDWWRQDNGPLVAFQSQYNGPMALLPASPSRYDLVEPTSGTRQRLTAALASQLKPHAYRFYRPFPARSLKPRTLFRFGLGGSRRDWVLVGVMGLAAAVLGLFTPIVTGWLFDWIIPGVEKHNLLMAVLALLLVTVADTLFRLAQGIAALRVETKMDAEVQAALWDRLLDLPMPFFRDYTTGDLASRAAGIGTMRLILTDVALMAVLNFIFSFVYVALLFYYDARLALLACGLFMVVVGITCLAAFRELPYQRRIYQSRGKIAGLVLQLLTGVTRLRVAGAEDRALAVWAKAFGGQRKVEFRARSVLNTLETFTSAAPLLTSLVLFATVALLPRQDFSLGMFLAFNVAFVGLLASAFAISPIISSLIELVPLYERVRPILETLPEVDEGKVVPADLRGDIEINHLSFRYRPDSPLVLDDISLNIRPGEFVAFVGPSGVGKSTILRLLLGFETPTAGAIFYDRENLTGLDRQAVRRQIGVVLQNARVMPGTILTNIIGSAPLTEEAAWEAARLSGLEADIRQMPQQMQTVLSEGDSTLSGGQRQRLMIARAIVFRPRMLFFDEATSALDNETQARVSYSLEQLKAARVVVAHRLSTIRNADKIYVLNAGKIEQQGTYDELLQQGGLFAELVKRQLA